MSFSLVHNDGKEQSPYICPGKCVYGKAGKERQRGAARYSIYLSFPGKGNCFLFLSISRPPVVSSLVRPSSSSSTHPQPEDRRFTGRIFTVTHRERQDRRQDMVIRSGGGWDGDESIRDRTGQERPANTLISTNGCRIALFCHSIRRRRLRSE